MFEGALTFCLEVPKVEINSEVSRCLFTLPLSTYVSSLNDVSRAAVRAGEAIKAHASLAVVALP